MLLGNSPPVLRATPPSLVKRGVHPEGIHPEGEQKGVSPKKSLDFLMIQNIKERII